MSTFAPIFAREGNRFCFVEEGYTTSSREQAYEMGVIATGMSGIRFMGEILHVTSGIVYYAAYVVGHVVAILSGPLFRKAVETAKVDQEQGNMGSKVKIVGQSMYEVSMGRYEHYARGSLSGVVVGRVVTDDLPITIVHFANGVRDYYYTDMIERIQE